MKKLFTAILLCAFCLWGADFWQTKPAAEWSDKDLQKMMNNSPWAHAVSVPMSGPTPPSLGRGGGNAADDTAAPQPISATPGGGRGGRGGGGGETPDGGGGFGGGGASATVVARWQSALPIKQAAERTKSGTLAAGSEEANYVIVVSGPLRAFLRGNPETIKKTIMDVSSLSVKGKDAVKPADLQIAGNQRTIDIAFAFPRSAAFTLDDKEVEFSTKLGDIALKYKFRLKDMVYNGKLEL
jgi:hypothetical protein